MAMIECKECKQKVSSQAKTCPSCGAAVPKQVGCLQSIGIAIVALFLFMFIFGKGTSKNDGTEASTAQPVEEVVIATSKEIAAAYDENEARGDALYKDKLIQVTGKVDSVNKDVTDNTVIILAGKKMFQSVHATLNDTEEQTAINVQKGQTVTLRCRGRGEVIGSPMLKDCVFVQ